MGPNNHSVACEKKKRIPWIVSGLFFFLLVLKLVDVTKLVYELDKFKLVSAWKSRPETLSSRSFINVEKNGPGSVKLYRAIYINSPNIKVPRLVQITVSIETRP